MKKSFVVAFVLIISVFNGYSFQDDTLNGKLLSAEIFSSFRSSFSTSYIIQKNYYKNDIRNFIFIWNADYYYKVSTQKFIQSYHVRADLGYMKFLDSSWSKYADGWKINILFEEQASSKITHAYSLGINSQFLSSYRFFSGADGKNTEQWSGGFLNPATLNFSYDVNITLWEYSNVLLGLSAIRISTLPRYKGATEPKESAVVKTDHAFILASYGMSGQVNIYAKKISDAVTWDNATSFFVNGVSKDRANFDFENKFTFKFLKYLQFRLDTHVIYDPLYSYSLQYRQEFLVGIFYEKMR